MTQQIGNSVPGDRLSNEPGRKTSRAIRPVSTQPGMTH